MKKHSHLSEFLFRYIHPEINQPLFRFQNEFANLAVSIQNHPWFGKKGEQIRPYINQQLKPIGTHYSKPVINHKKEYLMVINKRLEHLNVSEDVKKEILDKFEESFNLHCNSKLSNDLITKEDINSFLQSQSIDILELDAISVCVKANGGIATFSQVFLWLENIRK